MGTWGTGIYGNDTAEDVREFCNEIFPLVSVEEGNRIVFREFKDILEDDLIDDDYASFWYSLADWQWKHGILCEDIRMKTIQLAGQILLSDGRELSCEYGAGKLFGWIAKFIPYVGFLLGLIAGWLISYLLGNFFSNKRVKRIKLKFSSLVKNIRISLVDWIKNAVKSLSA